ncbi:MAG: flagellar hook assembly protein FlgD [Gemmatimonadaceae bacterium]
MITATTSTTPTAVTTPTTATSGDASSIASQVAGPGGALGKDEFLKLLIAQLQNQDPMNPMQGDQMASELAQFSSLEQLQEINTTLTGQQSSAGSLLGAVQAGAAINTIGHTVMAVGNQVQVGGTGGQSSVTVNLASAAASGTVHIYNSAGVEVGTATLGAMNAGQQSIDVSKATSGLPDGTYTYSVDAKDASGAAVAVTTYTTGKVTGISSDPNGITLTIGSMNVPYANVISIID